MDDCHCLTPPFLAADFEAAAIGVDERKGRFAVVTLETCRRCGRKWLRYFVEYEALPRSGRWYRGLLPADVAGSVSAHTAAAILENLDWYCYGGSYFDTAGKRGSGPLSLGL